MLICATLKIVKRHKSYAQSTAKEDQDNMCRAHVNFVRALRRNLSWSSFTEPCVLTIFNVGFIVHVLFNWILFKKCCWFYVFLLIIFLFIFENIYFQGPSGPPGKNGFPVLSFFYLFIFIEQKKNSFNVCHKNSF